MNTDELLAENDRLRNALLICFEVLHNELSHMITEGKDFNPVVLEAANASYYTLFGKES
jgi:hypothetical protein